MTINAFRSLSIGDKVSLLPDVTNTVSNVYFKVSNGTPKTFIEIDGYPQNPISEDVADLVDAPVTRFNPDTDAFESVPAEYLSYLDDTPAAR